ncbi:TIGR03085 family metal-binding protein, partial [Kineococcus glutinatus]|uniref:TIGR03085 family metal-binding protein n=1 Tax=Kineococcus glutinatus TaxID=1070872 RepID=UPI0031E994EE
LCDDALEAGPDAPTLCAGWSVRDLLVHLVVRDSRPDAAAGLVLPPLAGHSRAVSGRLAALPFDELVGRVRSGPPAWSPARLPGVAPLVNGAEFFVHHEDVRRAQPSWTPRVLRRDVEDALWSAVRTVGRLAYRRAGVGVVLVVPGGRRAVVRRGPLAVSVAGRPGELLLHAFGRGARALVDVDGSPEALRRFRSPA